MPVYRPLFLMKYLIKNADIGKVQPPCDGKPELPEPGACCGNGCENCVMDEYFEELAQWEKRNGEGNI